MCASFWVVYLASAMKVNAQICALVADRDIEGVLTQTTSVNTQKMVNYARTGQSQEKLSWRSEIDVQIVNCTYLNSFIRQSERSDELATCYSRSVLNLSKCKIKWLLWWTPRASDNPTRVTAVKKGDESMYQTLG